MLQSSEIGSTGLNNSGFNSIMQYESSGNPIDNGTHDSNMKITSGRPNWQNFYFNLIENGTINLSDLTLNDTIYAHCLVPDIENSKILVLICYNEADPFGKVIYDWLNNSAHIRTLLSNPTFISTLCNISSDSDRNNLIQSLTDIIKDQNDIFHSTVAGKSRIFLLVPHFNIIVSQSYIDESMSEDEAVSMLFYIKDFFNDIKKVRLEEQTKNDEIVNCESFQQVMMCRLRDRSYDIFFVDEHQYLKDKIGFAYFGTPINEDGTYSSPQNKQINKAYEAIISQSDNCSLDDGVVIISFIHICCIGYKKLLSTETNQLVSSVDKERFNPVPCFVLRKCYSEDNPSGTFCRIVIDNTLRVYSSWENFLHENTYPKCVICVPLDGRYDCDDNGDVLLEYYYSPSCNIAQNALRIIDTTAAVAGVGSGTLLLVAIIPTIVIAPFAIIGAIAISAGAGLYSIGRSIHRLVDRSMHDQSISPTSQESRAAYIGIIGGSLGFAGAGANVIIASLARNGVVIGQGATIAVNVISKANITAGGIALTNSICDIAHSYIVKKEAPRRLIFVQLGASVLFFANAIYSYKGATEIIAKAQSNNAIQEYNNSSKDPKGFSKSSGLLAALRRANNEDETVAMLTKNHEQFNELGIKYDSGLVFYNGQKMNIAQFTQAINTVDVVQITPPSNLLSKLSMNISLADINSLSLKIIPASSNAKDVEVAVLNILQLFAPTVQRKLLHLIEMIFTSDMCKPVFSFCEKFTGELNESLKGRGINVEFISQIINCLVSKAETALNTNLALSRGIRYIQVVVVNHYLYGRNITMQLVQDCIEHLNIYVAKKVVNHIKGSDEQEKIQTINKRKRLTCKKCKGFYHVKK